jgi:hypothetical protein
MPDYEVEIFGDVSGLIDSFETAKAASEDLKSNLEGLGESGKGLGGTSNRQKAL